MSALRKECENKESMPNPHALFTEGTSDKMLFKNCFSVFFCFFFVFITMVNLKDAQKYHKKT